MVSVVEPSFTFCFQASDPERPFSRRHREGAEEEEQEEKEEGGAKRKSGEGDPSGKNG